MEEEKTKLREDLFAFYFEDGEDRIPITSLLEKLKPIGEIWGNLHRILGRNVKYYNKASGLGKVKIMNYKNRNYLIIEIFLSHYIVIDLEAKKSLEKEEVKKIFDADFFSNNVYEKELESLKTYSIVKCQETEEIIAFFLENKDKLEMPNRIRCKFKIGEAFTFLCINLSSRSGQLGFETPNQALYEFLFFDIALNPWGGHGLNRIGIERSQEMFAKLKDIKIPRSVIPACFLIEEKTKLREALFSYYFEESEDRIPITSLLEKLNPTVEVWQNLRTILEENILEYDWSSGLELVKIIPYQGNSYLFIKENMWQYLIIDLNAKQVLSKEEATLLFSKEFFVQNLEEDEPILNEDWLDWCYECQNAGKIVEYCQTHEDILRLPNTIFCEFRIGEALTCLNIKLADNNVQLVFQTPDQLLYEFMHFDLDLKPWGMQDAHRSMGIEKMKEMFDRVKEAKIPNSFVPKEFLEDNTIIRKLERKE